MRLGVTSEIGKLKSVLVHLPGREIDIMIPPMMKQLLFDDILYGQVAREEHRRFQQLIRMVAEEVLDVQDLLEEAFENGDVKEEVVRDLARRNRLGRRLAERLLAQTPGALAEVLVGGIVSERSVSGELPKFDLLPVPNYFFMRDPQFVVGDGVVVSSMATDARLRESLLSKYVFKYHKAFRKHDLFWHDFTEDDGVKPARGRKRATIEGGDVLVARRDLLIVGHSERTNVAGIEQLAMSLKKSKAQIKTVIVVDMPKQRSFMHLDTIFTFISRNECLIYPPVLLPGAKQAAKVTAVDLTRKNIHYSPQKSLLGALKKQGFDLEPISCGGRRAVDQQREQWTDGANAFALSPGIVLLYERNVRTAEELDRHGYHLAYEDDLLLGRTELETWTEKKYAVLLQGNELSRARGGPRCMTMPLVREEV
ncbi:MAG TPA: arginine deiminase family protein [Thermoanaerobaculia bacterium]|nr:arginine deiminase family protein [Thermoanaerobaculia bacterium]